MIKFAGLCVLGLVALLGVAFALDYVTGSYGCSSKAAMMGMEHDFSVAAGCMIKVEDKWVPLDNYRVEP